MRLPKFDYLSPSSLNEALEMMDEYQNKRLKVLAGGTDLLVDLRSKVIPDVHQARCQEHRCSTSHLHTTQPETLEYMLSLSRIADLRGISIDGNRLRIGAMTTISELERSPLIREKLRGLCDGASQIGSPLVRNRGTYGGNLCNARPAADTAIPTLALAGKLLLISKRGERVVEHDDFVTAPGKTVLKPDEILKEVIFDLPEAQSGSAYIKLANRKALEISVVGAAAAVVIENGKVINARIALGAVAPRPLLVSEATETLIGKELTDENISEAASIASKKARPITDHRGGASYRKAMVKVLVERVLKLSRERALGGQGVEALS